MEGVKCVATKKTKQQYYSNTLPTELWFAVNNIPPQCVQDKKPKVHSFGGGSK